MNNLIHVRSVKESLQFMGLGNPKHPLISVFRHTKDMKLVYDDLDIVSDLYCIMLKDGISGEFNYGRGACDFEEGTMVFMAPGQRLKSPKNVEIDSRGWSIVFHPDLLLGSELATNIAEFSFFGYELIEALHVSEKERETLTLLVSQIESEITDNIDAHSHNLMLSNIQLLLSYCSRFYDRQFHTRKPHSGDVSSRFDKTLDYYFDQALQLENGLPSVSYCASKLNMSVNYLSDLLKKETGRTAQESLHAFVIARAKHALVSSTENISRVAFDLGFEYSQHFSKLFKAKTGLTPKEFRALH